jgi:hypothetical protein
MNTLDDGMKALIKLKRPIREAVRRIIPKESPSKEDMLRTLFHQRPPSVLSFGKEPSRSSPQGLAHIVTDGGGVRSLSSLLILEALMIEVARYSFERQGELVNVIIRS